MTPPRLPARPGSGFTLVELVVAILVLTIGLLAVVGSSIGLIHEIDAAGVRAQRAAAVQMVAEQIRALPFDSVAARSAAAPLEADRYSFSWGVAVHSMGGRTLKEVSLVAEGPGVVAGRTRPAVTDTAVFLLLEPS